MINAACIIKRLHGKNIGYALLIISCESSMIL